MRALSNFLALYGEGEMYAPLSSERATAWRGRLPDDLLDEWVTTGLRSFGDGFLWFCDPDFFAPVVAEWLPDRPECAAFARSAFCDLWLWDGVQTWLLDVHFARLLRFGATPLLMFNRIFTRDQMRQDVLALGNFQSAQARLGSPSWDEMYTYVPAIVLGGSIDRPETIQRVKLQEHLSFLRQAHGGIQVV